MCLGLFVCLFSSFLCLAFLFGVYYKLWFPIIFKFSKFSS
jgi:hypothetical protein